MNHQMMTPICELDSPLGGKFLLDGDSVGWDSWNTSSSYTESNPSTPQSDDGRAYMEPDIVPLSVLMTAHSERKVRLSRKAELARENRKKKKSRLEQLEIECCRLRELVNGYQKQAALIEHTVPVKSLDVNARSISDVRSDESYLHSEMQNLLFSWKHNQGKPDLTKFHAMASAFETSLRTKNSLCRAKLTDFNKLFFEDNKLPYDPAKFVQWILSRSDEFFQSRSTMWHRLFEGHIGLDFLQLEQLIEHREQAREQMSCSLELKETYTKLVTLFDRNLANKRHSLSILDSIMSPDQKAKMYGWCFDNELCLAELIENSM